VEVRAHKASLAGGAARLELLRKNAETLRVGLRALERAVDVNHQILAERPGDLDALDTLEELYETLEQWESLVQVLIEKVELSHEPEERRLLYQQIATLREDALEEVDGAIDAYLAMLDIEPTDPVAMVALERLYEQTERWTDLAGILRRRLNLFEDRAYRIEIALRLGGVLERKLRDTAGAIELCRDVLELDPTNMPAVISLESRLSDEEHRLAALDVLLPVYEKNEMWRDVARLLDARLQSGLEPEDRLETLLRLCEVNEQRLGNITGAFSAACRAYEAVPKGDLREQAERLAQHTGDYVALAEAYERAQDSVETDDNALLIHMRLAELYLSPLGAREKAEEQYRQALEIAPDNLDALEALETLYEEAQRPEQLLDIFERRVELARDGDDVETALLYLYRIAALQEEVLKEPAAAVAAWRRSLDLAPSDAQAFTGLNRLFRAEGQWVELVDLLSEQLTQVGTEEAVAELRHEQATVLAEELDEPAAGIETWAEVLRSVAGHAGALASLERLAKALAEPAPEVAARACELLEPHYRETEAWRALAWVLEQRARAAEPTVAADLLTEAAALYERQLGEARSAFERYGEVFELQPHRQVVWAELERLARETERFEDLAALVAQGIESGDGLTDRELPALGLLLGRVRDHALGDVQGARKAYEGVLEIEPADETALEALERLYSQIPEWEELVALYRRRADLVEVQAERLPYLLKIGRLKEELSDPEAAVQAYRSVLELEPANDEAQGALERLFNLEGRHEDLADLLERRATLEETDAERAEVLHQLGRVLEVDLGAPGRAVGVYRRVLALAPEHGRTIGALEAQLAQLRGEEGEPGVRMDIIEALESVYAPETHRARLIALCEARLEIEEEPAARVQALHRAGELAEQGGDPREAFELYARAFREDPSHRGTTGHLERLAEVTRTWAELAEAYIDGLRRLSDPALAVKLMLRTAELFEEALQEPEGAARVLEELLDVEPRNLEALGRLDRLYRELGRFEALVDVLFKKAELTDDPLDQKEFLYQVADIQEKRLQSVEEAAETFRRILDLDAEDIVALESLERLLRRTERWTALVDILLSKAEVVGDEVERRSVYLDMAGVYEESMGDPTAAIGVYRTLLGADPADPVAVAALDRLYRETESWGELLDILDVQRGLTEDPEERDRLELRSARVLIDELGDVARAIELFRTLLERSPRQPAALEALYALLEGPYREEATNVLEPLHREWGDWERVVWLLEQRVAHEVDESHRHMRYREMAELAETRLERPDVAFAATARALAEVPEDAETVEHLFGLASRNDYWESLAETLDEVAGTAANPETRRALWLRAAEVYERELDQVGEAVGRYRKVLETHPHDPVTLKALDRLFFNERDWEALAAVLQREIAIATEEEEQLDLRFRLGYIREMVFQDAPGAIALYAEALGMRSDFDKALESLERLLGSPEHSREVTLVLAAAYEREADWPKLVEVYSTALDHEAETERRAELLKRVAELEESRLGHPARAFELYGHALREQPGDPQGMERFEALAGRLDAWAEAAALYDELQERVEPLPARLEVLGKLADWYDTVLGQPSEAEARFLARLRLDPEDERVRDRLEALYEREQSHAALFDLLGERADRAPSDEARQVLLERMGRLAKDSLADPSRTAAVYERLRALDPSDREVVLELVRLYAQLGEIGRLVVALGHQAELEPAVDKQAALYHQVAKLSEVQLADARGAAEAYAKAIALDPTVDARYTRLEALWTELGEGDARRALLEEWLERVDGDEKLAVGTRLAEVLEREYGDTAGAAACYEGLLAFGLELGAGRLGELARLQAELERWADLDATFSRIEGVLRADAEAHRGELVALLEGQGELRAEQLEDPEGAIASFRAVLALEPHHRQALHRLGRLLEGQELWGEALETVTREIALVGEEPALADLYHRRGRLLGRTGASRGEVIGALERALEADGGRLDVAEDLLSEYRAAGRWGSVWEMLTRLTRAKETPEEQRELAREAARVAREQLGDSARLVEALELGHELDPSDLGVVEELAAAYLEIGAHGKASPLVDRLVEARSERGSKRDMARLHHLRGVAAQGMGDAAAAEASFEEAYRCDGGYLPNLMSLARLRYQQGDMQEALRLYQTMLLQQTRLKSAAERVEIFYHIGRIMSSTGDRRRARDMYMRALSIDRDHEPSQRGLAELE
jgi:golgin subfamily B member 1